MQSTPVSPLPNCCCYPIPNLCLQTHHSHSKFRRKPTSFSLFKIQIHSQIISSLTLLTTNHCSQKQEKNHNNEHTSPPNDDPALFEQLYSLNDTQNIDNQNQESQIQGHEEYSESEFKNFKVLFTNMWWADLKAALGQRINVEGIVSSAVVLVRDRHLALPNVAVPDIRYLDWAELHRRGFKGVVFDKDNTITAPYSLTLWGPLGSSFEQCKAVFGHDIAVFSNSAGLLEYDHDGSKAKALERAIGIKVIRHRVKKPAGTAKEVEKHFGCPSSQLIMVGDRPFTDIVFGNRNGFLTILTEPLSLAEEPFIVKQGESLNIPPGLRGKMEKENGEERTLLGIANMQSKLSGKKKHSRDNWVIVRPRFRC